MSETKQPREQRCSLRVVFMYGVTLPRPVASSVQTINMATALAELGASVYLACDIAPGYDDRSLLEHYGVPSNIRILSSATAWQPRGIRSLFMICDQLRRFRWQWLCYTRTPTIATIAAWLGVPTVLELHSIPIDPIQRRFLSLLSWAPGLRRVVVISQGLRQLVSQAFPKLVRHILVSPDAVDVKRFRVSESRKEAREKLGLPLEARIVGYTGRLTAGKGVHILLEAIRGASFLTCIVGGFPQDPSDLLEKYSRESSSPQVFFMGYQPPSKMPLFLRAFDVAVAPFTKEPISRLTIRGKVVPYDIHEVMSPLKIFEYMASGTPMITSDLPVLREVLIPGKTALMIPPGDPKALRDAIDNLLIDKEKADLLGQRAQHVSLQYTWTARARTIFADLVLLGKADHPSTSL